MVFENPIGNGFRLIWTHFIAELDRKKSISRSRYMHTGLKNIGFRVVAKENICLIC